MYAHRLGQSFKTCHLQQWHTKLVKELVEAPREVPFFEFWTCTWEKLLTSEEGVGVSGVGGYLDGVGENPSWDVPWFIYDERLTGWFEALCVVCVVSCVHCVMCVYHVALACVANALMMSRWQCCADWLLA
jgi:hypothetical protein